MCKEKMVYIHSRYMYTLSIFMVEWSSQLNAGLKPNKRSIERSITIFYGILLARKIYGYWFKITCGSKFDKFNQIPIECHLYLQPTLFINEWHLLFFNRFLICLMEKSWKNGLLKWMCNFQMKLFTLKQAVAES